MADHLSARLVDCEQSECRARLAEALLGTAAENREAFRFLYSLTSSKLFGICLRICGERTAAEDVLADVYLKIWKRAAAWDPGRGSAISWLATIARNAAIDWRRTCAMRGIEVTCHGYDVVDDAPNAETVLLSAEGDARLDACLRSLMPDQQSAIRAAFFDGLTYAELAARRGVPLGTIKSWVRRGLARMREDLLRDDQDSESDDHSHPSCRTIPWSVSLGC